MNILYSHIKLFRPLNVFISAMAMVIASAILGALHEINIVILVIAVVICYTSAANSLNDFLDAEIDLINRPLRPIPSGNVTKNTALVLSILLFIFGTLLSLELSKLARVIGILIAMPLMVVYSKYLKGLPLIGNMTIALILGLSFLFCGAAFGKIESMWIPMLLAFGLTFVRELIKDIADIEGDKSAGLRTFPITAGVNRAIQVTIFLSACIGIGSFVPFLNGSYGMWYAIILILGIEIPLGLVVVSLLNKPEVLSAAQGARILKFSTIMGLIAIYAGTFS